MRTRAGLGVAAVVAVVALMGACARRPQTETVALAGVAFKPDTVSAAVGDTVVFRNDDPVPHTATSDRGAFDSGDIAPGKSWRWVAPAAGRFPYHCTYHPNMTGVVVVK